MYSSYSDCFLQAQKVRQLIKNDFDAVFAKVNPLNGLHHTDRKAPDGVDVLITPVTISTAPKITEVTDREGRNAVDAYVNDVMTIPASLAGINEERRVEFVKVSITILNLFILLLD